MADSDPRLEMAARIERKLDLLSITARELNAAAIRITASLDRQERAIEGRQGAAWERWQILLVLGTVMLVTLLGGTVGALVAGVIAR